MTFDCPICGQEIAPSQFSFEEDMCFNCLQKLEVYVQQNDESNDFDHSLVEEE